MGVHKFEDNSEDEARFREMVGPAQVDRQIRQAIQFCWLSLPKARRHPDEMESHIRRMVDRAIKDFREDFKLFFQ